MIPEGIILLDKKEGITSMASDNFIKKLMNTRKVGHSGTLDPFATGLLPVFTGRALKVMRYTDDYDKGYRCVAVFGKRTDTMDTEGVVTAQCVLHGTGAEFDAIREAFAQLKEITSQTPPLYSAKKINGRKAYELARQGVEVELKSHPVKIYSLDICDMKYADGQIEVTFDVECSKGTYIRSLCDSCGEMTGFHAFAKELRRTKCGPFAVDDAYTEEALSDMAGRGDYSFVTPREKALDGMKRIDLNLRQTADVKLGKKISSGAFGELDEGLRVAAFEGDELIAVLYREGEIMRIERMLAVD